MKAVQTTTLTEIYGMYTDLYGNLYYSFSDLAVIYKMSGPNSNPVLFAGIYNVTAIDGGQGDGGLATSATLFYPAGMIGDTNGNLYIVDDCSVRKISSSNIITTVAGIGSCKKSGGVYGGDGGLATITSLVDPFDLAVDVYGNIYIGDEGGIRLINYQTGIITTIYKTSFPSIAIDQSNNLYISTFINNQILRLNTFSGQLVTIAGNGTGSYSPDGQITNITMLNGPYYLRLIPGMQQILIFSETGTNLVRSINFTSNIITTIAGTGLNTPIVLGPANPLSVNLRTPWSLAPGPNSIYLSESNGDRQNGVPLHIYYLNDANLNISLNYYYFFFFCNFF